ncbi:RNA binding motif protein X-linked 2, partial [Perkinsus olseni]
RVGRVISYGQREATSVWTLSPSPECILEGLGSFDGPVDGLDVTSPGHTIVNAAVKDGDHFLLYFARPRTSKNPESDTQPTVVVGRPEEPQAKRHRTVLGGLQVPQRTPTAAGSSGSSRVADTQIKVEEQRVNRERSAPSAAPGAKTNKPIPKSLETFVENLRSALGGSTAPEQDGPTPADAWERLDLSVAMCQWRRCVPLLRPNQMDHRWCVHAYAASWSDVALPRAAVRLNECSSAKELVYGMFDSPGGRFAEMVDAGGDYSDLEARGAAGLSWREVTVNAGEGLRGTLEQPESKGAPRSFAKFKDKVRVRNASYRQKAVVKLRYRDSAYLYLGNLDRGLTEGDLITVFSQFGEIMDINLVRDKETGKSKGFGFLAYEDQRSTRYAIDNMIGFNLVGRPLKVDHVNSYRAPIVEDPEGGTDAEGNPVYVDYKATGAEGMGLGVAGVTESQKMLDQLGKNRARVTAVRDKKWMVEDPEVARRWNKEEKKHRHKKEKSSKSADVEKSESSSSRRP